MPKKSLATTIDGRRYRSQLEARWAQFFRYAGWRFEYEPFQLVGWVPDFLLMGESAVLVEIKPTHVFPYFIQDKIEESLPPHDVLVLGCSIPVRPYDTVGVIAPDTIGWLAERSGDADHTHLWWGDAVIGQSPMRELDFAHRDGSPFGRMRGTCLSPASPYLVRSKWADAGNKAQWSPT